MGKRRVTVDKDEKIRMDDIQDEEAPREREVDFQKTQEYDTLGDIYRKLLEKPRITEVPTTVQDVEDLTKAYKDDARDSESLDITRYEKQPLQQKTVEKKSFVQTEEVGKTQKVSIKKLRSKTSIIFLH